MPQIRSVLIIGGGSAGWMTAAYLAHCHPGISITLIESPDIRPIGVGESTNAISRLFNMRLGLNETEFLREVNGSYKIGIRFQNFYKQGEAFYHPFGLPVCTNLAQPGADRCFISTHLCEQNRFSAEVMDGYGYQLDAVLYGEVLKRCALNNGVEYREATLCPAEIDSNGHIARVGGFKADLYVDCTGFRSLLMSDSLQQPFLSLNSTLINDSAIATQVPYSNPELECCPYTNCYAADAGWIWNIPLFRRRGVGYVYSSVFKSPAEAEEELRHYIGEVTARNLPFKQIRIRNGRHKQPWVGNCVGIGLAYGFIEPLESTGIALTQLSIMMLADLLFDRDGFNRTMNTVFDETVEFILAHYMLSNRTDTAYWLAARNAATTTSLTAILSSAQSGDYSALSVRTGLYNPSNWQCILSGMHFFDDQIGHATPGRPQRESYKFQISAVPNHFVYLNSRVHKSA